MKSGASAKSSIGQLHEVTPEKAETFKAAPMIFDDLDGQKTGGSNVAGSSATEHSSVPSKEIPNQHFARDRVKSGGRNAIVPSTVTDKDKSTINSQTKSSRGRAKIAALKKGESEKLFSEYDLMELDEHANCPRKQLGDCSINDIKGLNKASISNIKFQSGLIKDLKKINEVGKELDTQEQWDAKEE